MSIFEEAMAYDAGPQPNEAKFTFPEDWNDTKKKAIQEPLIKAFKEVYDPEIPVDIYELGLIYAVAIDENSQVNIEMTLTAPGCPVAGEMPDWVEKAAESVPGVQSAQAEITFDPPWTMERMSEEARVCLDML